MFIRDPSTARIGVEILPLEVGYLPEFFQRKAEVELHDTPERRVQGLRQIKEMAKNDKILANLNFDDDFLLQYLRCRKFNVARAFSQLKSFVSLRKRNPALFTNYRFEQTVKSMRNKIVTLLPYRCQDGCAIFLIQLDNWDPEDFPPEEVKRMVVVLLLQSLRDPMTQVNGFKAIFDVKSNPIKHIRHCTPQNMYLLYHGTQECSPGRFKQIHIVNQSPTFKAAWLLIKPFLSAKLKKRMYFHSTSETLFNFFPRAVLPVHYGGELEDYDMTNWLKSVMQPEKLATIGGGVAPEKKAK
ncbi:alpha-tocopherol transfer protein-like [Stegodyphus dumicola]|uniref:alpha-tocopherol transfer protein-like n=1 Tax=Stegodyphus dumicola TaxID=202533 RepID=UPI0015A8379D|nr:alpha-tocopherol transfer protein-like [Stegodyphus dumicola]